jgi:Kef-type K+ transport system membrane component KefB
VSASLLSFLIALSVVVLAARACAFLCGKLGQPPVMGEVLAGIALGPSLFGRLWPAAQATVFPPAVTPVLGLFAQVGVILYMFVVGLELDAATLRQRGKAVAAISFASMAVPFASGLGLAALLPQRFGSGLAFTLFIGVAMSVTAFPVLARILSDRRATHTHVGQLALTCAAINDVAAWCLLATVVAVAQHSALAAVRTAVLTLAFAGVMGFGVRPLVRRIAHRGDSDRVFAVVLAALLVCALASEVIGIHAIFGAFLFGAVIPHDSALAHALQTRVQTLVAVLLLPIFFAFTGLRTQLGLVSGVQAWALTLAVIAVASVAKFSGTFLAARGSREPVRVAAALGVLMNTRGLMELIVLNVGLELGLLTPALFAVFVIMALVTTFATTPLYMRLAGES